MNQSLLHKILIIDDDHDDLEIMRDVFENEARTENSMISSGRKMMPYLDGIPEDKDLPRMILTDYFMPGMTGAEVVKNLKEHKRYRDIDVVVYSSSYIDSIVTICEGLGARAFLRKPASVTEYQQMMDRVLTLIDEKTS